jgi:hypothetical protein
MRLKSLLVALLIFAMSQCVSAAPPPEKDATLAVLVTWGDVDNTPAQNVYVEAHGYVANLKAKKSFVLDMVRAGRYEVSLPPGVYDVFVSDGSSEPRCRRMRVAAGDINTWILKLETDEIYTQH